jgi:hypothetical protein
MDAPYQAMENESFVTVTFGVINGTLEREVAVELSILDGTAVGESPGKGHANNIFSRSRVVWFSGSVFLLNVTYVVFAAGYDYDGTVAPQVFIFSSDVSIITFQLPLIDDGIFEISESLLAHLSLPSPMLPPRAFSGPDTADIIIVDEDSKYFSGSSVRNC